MPADRPAEVPGEAGKWSVQRLEQGVGARWKTLAEAPRLAFETRAKLADALAGITSSDLSVVAFGSLARDEFTPGSDVDWTLLVDGMAIPFSSMAMPSLLS